MYVSSSWTTDSRHHGTIFLGICNDLHVKHVKACYVTNIFMSGRYIRVEWTLFCKLTMFVTRWMLNVERVKITWWRLRSRFVVGFVGGDRERAWAALRWQGSRIVVASRIKIRRLNEKKTQIESEQVYWYVSVLVYLFASRDAKWAYVGRLFQWLIAWGRWIFTQARVD